MLDFILLNGDVGAKQLKEMDQHISGAIDRTLKVRGLSVECHHDSWRDRRLSYPSLLDRREALLVRSFTQMMLSKDRNIRGAMRWITEEEHKYLDIDEDPDSSFLNWSNEGGENVTAYLATQTKKTWAKLKIQLKLDKEEMVVKTEQSEFKTRMTMRISHFLTQNVIRSDKFRKLIGHEVHGATHTTLKGNEVSNQNLINVYIHKSDEYFRFMVVRRADCLPTPVNLQQ
jgi:hypothetical protein